MITITVRNVNEALPAALVHFRGQGMRAIDARGGARRVECPFPWATVYLRPRERVLFSPVRDANPYFHFMESLWILAGRGDVAWVAQFLPRIGEYSDNGRTFHGAYGRRIWDDNQLTRVIYRLRTEPNSTRCVLQIYNHNLDVDYAGKDMPCNDIVFFQLREAILDITVCNRSNDLIWGSYGANAVQFSMLQEYVANKVGADCGWYTQFSANTHVYPDNEATKRCLERIYPLEYDPYADGTVAPVPLGAHNDDWDKDLQEFMLHGADGGRYHTVFFNLVALPMARSHASYRANQLDQAYAHAINILAPDWKRACVEWLQRRIDKRAKT